MQNQTFSKTDFVHDVCDSYLHQVLIAGEARHQDILPICDPSERDAQSACGLGVRIMWH